MTAGRGVSHSEHNLDVDNPLRFIQIWIQTRQRGLPPNYGSFVGDDAARQNNWAHLVSDVKGTSSTPIKINQDANIFVTEVAAGSSTQFEVASGRQAYLLCIEGTASIVGSHDSRDVVLERHDAAEIHGPTTLRTSPVSGEPSTHMLIVEMQEVPGDGRTDI